MYFKWSINLYFQTWGIETVNGERRYARHVKFTGPKGQEIQARLAYDYREWSNAPSDSKLTSTSWPSLTLL